MPPSHAQHPSPQDLAAFAVGKLSGADAGTVAAHLADCPDCRHAAERAHGDTFVARLKAAEAPGPTDPTRLPNSVRLAPAAPQELPPELANHPRYRILRELGRGGMGVVYQARQIVMNRPVVIKVISKTLLDQPGAVERFRREVQAAAKLAHPNIVAAYDAEQAGELHMLVMEFVPGQSLAEALHKKGPLPVLNACVYVRQAALGLQHAHEQGMVHRDIKPQNLMLTPKGQVKILDFGLAKLVSEHGSGTGLTALNAYVGTPDYSAPEQATDARSADIRADIYSLGCTLYCLLAGRPPFHEKTAVQTILAHLEKEPTPLPELRPGVSAAVWAVVARMLAKDPARRHQTPAEVAQALVPFCKPRAQTRPEARAASCAGIAPADPPVADVVAEREWREPSMTSVAQPADRRWWLGGMAVALVCVLGFSVCLVGALLFWAGQLVGRPSERLVRTSGPSAPVVVTPPMGPSAAEKPAPPPPSAKQVAPAPVQTAPEPRPAPGPGVPTVPAQPGEPAKSPTPGQSVQGSGHVVTEERKLADFRRVEVDTPIQVTIRRGDTFGVAVTADDNLVPLIKTAKYGVALLVGKENGSFQTSNPIRVEVTMPALEGVRLTKGGRAKIGGFRGGKEFLAELTTGTLEGEILADKLDINTSGNSQAKLIGSAKDAKLRGSGAAQLHLADFAADNVDVDLGDASLAEVQAKARLDYNLRGASQLHYRGSPVIGNATTAGAARAVRMPP